MNKPAEKLRYLNISADESGIYEYEDSKCLNWLPVADIVGLSKGYGYLVRFPVFVLLLGAMLILVSVVFGVLPIIQAIIYSINSGTALKGYGLVTLFIIFGFWFIKISFRKGHYISVETKRGQKKLEISGGFDEKPLNDFIQDAKNMFGLQSQ